MIVVTNNANVLHWIKDVHHAKAHYVKGHYGEVLKQVRDLVHQHYKLLTHPLSGSIKPNETPFKSIALESGNTLDWDSLALIEKAIETYEKMQKDEVTPLWNDSILDDFRVIDSDLMFHAIKDKCFPS